jgi:hypothetical protein
VKAVYQEALGSLVTREPCQFVLRHYEWTRTAATIRGGETRGLYV